MVCLSDYEVKFVIKNNEEVGVRTGLAIVFNDPERQYTEAKIVDTETLLIYSMQSIKEFTLHKK